MNHVRAVFSLFPILAWVSLAQEIVPSGEMVRLRYMHRVVELQDGRVLAIGGYYQGKSDASAELFDPKTGRWRATANMTVPRAGASAIRLNDGRVLVAGGGYTAVDIFDPATETFMYAGDASSRYAGNAVKLADGRILLMEGSGRNGDLYEPGTGKWRRLPPIESGVAIALPDGRLVMIEESSALIYRVEQDYLQPLIRHDLGMKRLYPNSVLLTNGRILIAGGGRPGVASLYDPRTGSVTPTSGVANALYLFDLLPLRDGTAFATGGYTDYYSEIYEGPATYDPDAGRFIGRISLPIDRTVIQLGDGRLMGSGTGPLADGDGWPSSFFYTPPARVVSAASFTNRVALGSLATIWGAQFADGVTLSVMDQTGATREARILYVSSSQINFEVPAELRSGPLQLTVQRPGLSNLVADVESDTVAPGLFSLPNNVAAAYAERREADGTSTVLSVQSPIVLDQRPVSLVLYGTGIRNRTTVGNVICNIGGIIVGVDYAGPDGGGVSGLDQVNVRIPEALRGRGIVDLSLKVDGVDSNTVLVEIR